MVGVLGAAGTAAVSVNAAPIWLANGLLTGVGVGYSVQVSNAIGARRRREGPGGDPPGGAGRHRGGPPRAAALPVPGRVHPPLAGGGAEVLPQAVAYLRFYTMAMPFMAAGQIFSAILRCMGNTRAPLYFNTAANLLNIVLNFLLIYPTRPAVLFGAQITIPGAGLGAAGAAIASAAALTTAGIALLRIGTRQGDRFRVHLREGLRPDGAIYPPARLGACPPRWSGPPSTWGRSPPPPWWPPWAPWPWPPTRSPSPPRGCAICPPTASPTPASPWWARPWGPGRRRTPGPTAPWPQSWALWWPSAPPPPCSCWLRPWRPVQLRPPGGGAGGPHAAHRGLLRALLRPVHHPLRHPPGRPRRASAHGGGAGVHVGHPGALAPVLVYFAGFGLAGVWLAMDVI